MPFGSAETLAHSIAATPVVVARNARDRVPTRCDPGDACLFAEAAAGVALKAWFPAPAAPPAARCTTPRSRANNARPGRLATSLGADRA